MMKRLTFSLIILSFAITLFLVPRVEACECPRTISGTQPCHEYWSASAVFVGRVSDISPIERDRGGYISRQRFVRFTIIEAFRGVEGNSVEILTDNTDCRIDFKRDENYFVYARRNPNTNKLHAGMCSLTRLLSEASGDVEYARAIARGELGGIIFGIVLDYGNGIGMEGISITIEGNDRRFNLKTDNRGRFQLNGLPAGT